MKKVFEIALPSLIGVAETTLPGSANATAIINIIYDAFDIGACAIWGENTEELAAGYHEPLVGTIDDDRLLGSLLADVSTDRFVSSGSNMATATTRISSVIGKDRLSVNLRSNLETGPGGKGGYGYSKSQWNLVFDIVGDGAKFSNIQTTSAGLRRNHNKTVLFDMTSGLFYDGHIDNISLLGGHAYTLFAESVQQDGGTDGASELGIEFWNVHLKVLRSQA